VDRRNFLLLGAGTLLASRPALAARKLPRIGFIGPGSREMNQALLAAFRDGLDELGWADNGDLVILDRWAEERIDRLPQIAGELIGSGVDILVTAGTAATLAARSATATIPIVLIGVGDPVAAGVVSSLAQPDGNATGLSLSSSELTVKRLQLLRELVPSLSRIAVMVRDDPGLEQKLLEIRSDAGRMGLKLVEFTVTTGKTLELAFLWLRSDRYDALYLESGPLGPAKRAEIIALTAESRIPAIYPFRVFAAAGGLMSLAPDDNDLFRRAATFVDKLLNGAKPADLPVERPIKFELVINLKTAEALGLSIPQSLLARADEIIE
jgi:putative tryptophan/tyrosine transport system substrate-binding protein